jgi:hypothetical protein
MWRTLTTIAGIILLLFGALFLLQGLDIVRWPADSFMIANQVWIFRGAAIAAAGIVLLAMARLR